MERLEAGAEQEEEPEEEGEEEVTEEEEVEELAEDLVSTSEDEEEKEARRKAKRKENWKSDQRVASDDSDIEAVDFEESEAVSGEHFPVPERPDVDEADKQLILAALAINQAKVNL